MNAGRVVKVGWLAIIAAYITQTYLILLWFAPGATFQVSEVSILRNVYFATDAYVSYDFTYCKTFEAPASSVSREFLSEDKDGVTLIAQLPTAAGDLAPGCHSVRIRVDIPESLPDGVYQLQVVRQWDVNALRTLTSKLVTPKFELRRGR